jgi:F-type H+-transporting ATPase subunit delta
MIRSYARPYAKAVMEVAQGAEGARGILDELERFDEARRSSQPLRDAMENPAVALEQRLGITREIAARLELGELTVRVLEVLVRNRRINQLGAVVDALQMMVHDAAGVSVAKVRAAHELDQEQREDLRRALEARFGGRVELEVSTDADLLGGFVAQLGSEIYDASVRGRIESLREALA